MESTSTAESSPSAPQIIPGYPGESREAFIDRWTSEYERDPDNTARPGCCVDCSASLTVPDMTLGGPGFWMANIRCEPCKTKRIAEIKADDTSRRLDWLASRVPPEFCAWDEMRGNSGLLARARGKFDLRKRRGLILHGPSGTCKTRVAWQLIADALLSGLNFSWHWLDASDIESAPADATQATLLVIDDLGAETKSGRGESNLLRIIRKRCDWHRPTVITTQLTGKEFGARCFAGHIGQAVLRRLMERSDALDSH